MHVDVESCWQISKYVFVKYVFSVRKYVTLKIKPYSIRYFSLSSLQPVTLNVQSTDNIPRWNQPPADEKYVTFQFQCQLHILELL